MRKLSGATPVFVTMQWFSTYGSLAGPVWIACDNVNVKLACAEPQHSTPKKTALPRLQWRRVAFMMSHFMTVSFLAAVCAGRCGVLSRDESSESVRAHRGVDRRLGPHCARHPRI